MPSVLAASQTAGLAPSNCSLRSSLRLDFSIRSPLDLPSASIFGQGSVEVNLIKGWHSSHQTNPTDDAAKRFHWRLA
jgi:hypothetical protein